MTIAELLDVLWRDYVATTPQAAQIRALLTQRGERLGNDHIGFRSFGAPGIGIADLARPFEALGWQPREHHRYSNLHLRACTWMHADRSLPRVFISELIVDELSPEAQAQIAALVAQLPTGFTERADLAWAGRPWPLCFAAYQALRAESEYAAWVAAFGFRVHHVAVDIASLSTFPDLAALNAFLIEHGFVLDDDGGLIKGSLNQRIEQSRTRPESVAVVFDDVTAQIPSCYYEFARELPRATDRARL